MPACGSFRWGSSNESKSSRSSTGERASSSSTSPPPSSPPRRSKSCLRPHRAWPMQGMRSSSSPTSWTRSWRPRIESLCSGPGMDRPGHRHLRDLGSNTDGSRGLSLRRGARTPAQASGAGGGTSPLPHVDDPIRPHHSGVTAGHQRNAAPTARNARGPGQPVRTGGIAAETIIHPCIGENPSPSILGQGDSRQDQTPSPWQGEGGGEGQGEPGLVPLTQTLSPTGGEGKEKDTSPSQPGRAWG